MSEWQTVGKHALRNALILIITPTGILLSAGDRRLGHHRAGVRAAGYIGRMVVAGDHGAGLSAGAGDDADPRFSPS